MVDRQVYCTVEAGVMTITIDNPEMKNGINYIGINQFCECLELLRDDESIKVAVITGADEWFYTGGRVDPNAPGENKLYADGIERYQSLIEQNEKPIIAAVNGHCLKAGMGVLCNADIAIAKRSAEFGYPEVRMGGVPMMVMLETMDYLPKKLAMEAFITCWNFSADEAYRIGLLNKVVDSDDDFNSEIKKYVDVFLNTPYELVRLTKKAYRGLSDLPRGYERSKFAMEMLRNEVLPTMQKVKQEYNV